MSVRHCNRYNNIARPWKLVPPHFSLRVSVELSGIMETGKPCLSTVSTPALSTYYSGNVSAFPTSSWIGPPHSMPAIAARHCHYYTVTPPLYYICMKDWKTPCCSSFPPITFNFNGNNILLYHSLICRSLILNMISKRRSKENVFVDTSSLADV